MTDPIAVDVPVRPPVGTRPAPLSTAPKPGDKSKPADAGKVPPPPPVPKSLVAWLADRVSKRQLALGASAVCSLAAGIAGVRLMWPGDDRRPTADATQPLAAEPNPQQPARPAEPPKLT